MTHSSSEQSTSKKTEEPVCVLSDEEKKAILVHYVRKIAKMIKKNKYFLDTESRKVAMAMLFLEIRYRIDNWFNIPCIEGAPHEKLAALSGCLLRKLDNINSVNASTIKKVDPVVQPKEEPVVAKAIPSVDVPVQSPKELTREEKVDCLKKIWENCLPTDAAPSTIAKAMDQIKTECGHWVDLPKVDVRLSIGDNYALLMRFIAEQITIMDVLMAPFQPSEKQPFSDEARCVLLKDVMGSLSSGTANDNLLLQDMVIIRNTIGKWMAVPVYIAYKSIRFNFGHYRGYLASTIEELEKKIAAKPEGPVAVREPVSLVERFDTISRINKHYPALTADEGVRNHFMMKAKDDVKEWLIFPAHVPDGTISQDYERFVEIVVEQHRKIKAEMIRHVLSEVGEYILEVTETRVFTGEQANKITDLLMRDLGFERIPICIGNEHDFNRLSRLCEWLAKGYLHLKSI